MTASSVARHSFTRCIIWPKSAKWHLILIVLKRNSSTRNKTNKKSRERLHHGRRHLRRPQSSGLRKLHRSARGRNGAVGFRRQGDQDRAARIRRSLPQP